MPMRLLRQTLPIISIALLLAPPSFATTVLAKSFAALCNEADLVFIGTVSQVTSQWSDPEVKAIETLVTFSNVEPLWGNDASDVTLRFGGGQVGDLHEEVAGMPHFLAGERVLIFA